MLLSRDFLPLSCVLAIALFVSELLVLSDAHQLLANPGNQLSLNSSKSLLTPRSIRKGSPIKSPSSQHPVVFDPKYAKSELRTILTKYKQASQFLRGIGLGPIVDLSSHIHDLSGGESSTQDSLWSAREEQINFHTSHHIGNDSQSFLPKRDSSLLPPTPYPQTPPAPPPSLLNPKTGNLPLKALLTPSGLEILYYAQISLGTPDQLLTVDIDTGSADAWFPVECWQCANKEFIPERSTTYSSDGDAFDVSYGSGDVSGIIAEEVVALASLSVKNQSFGAVNRVSAEWNEYPNDGLLGLAFSTISVSSKPTFFENLILQEQVAAPSFSVFLARGKEDGSSLCLGCWDPLKVSSRDARIYWVPVVSRTYWSVWMDGFVINGKRAEVNLVAAIDTGTTLIYLPELVAAALYQLIPGAKPSAEHGPEFYTFPCYGAPLQVAFSFDGQPFSINMFDFNLGRASATSNDCVGGIVSLGKGFPSNLAIIGDEFLKSWYTTFDYANGVRVGFARSANED